MGQKQSAAHRAGRTVFQGRVLDPPEEARNTKLRIPLHVLMWADNNSKIGGFLERGSWYRKNGRMPIFSLTLEERATCPTSCRLWRSCYGDNMHMAIRWKAGWDLLGALEVDLTNLENAYPNGFLVRLHVLGDFYSTAYVEFWRHALRTREALYVYGYTHRQPGTPIGDAITQMTLETRERCAMMRSDPTTSDDPLPHAVVIPFDATAPAPGTVICPNEQGRTKSCGTCGLCMNGRTSVSFLDHSNAVIRARRTNGNRVLPTA